MYSVMTVVSSVNKITVILSENIVVLAHLVLKRIVRKSEEYLNNVHLNLLFFNFVTISQRYTIINNLMVALLLVKASRL